MLRVVAAACRETGVVSHTMPGVFELLDGDVSVSRLRQVDITDLLRRDPVVSSPDASSFVEGPEGLIKMMVDADLERHSRVVPPSTTSAGGPASYKR